MYIEGRIKKPMPNTKRSVPMVENSFSLVALVYSGTKHISIIIDSVAMPNIACCNAVLRSIPFGGMWLTRVKICLLTRIKWDVAGKFASMAVMRVHINVNAEAIIGRKSLPCSKKI